MPNIFHMNWYLQPAILVEFITNKDKMKEGSDFFIPDFELML